MNDRLTISSAQLLALFPDEQSARHYIESRRWPNGVRCPVCDSDRIGPHSPGIYRCNACEEAFSVRTGTVMERSKIPLTDWLHALWLIVSDPEISSPRLAAALTVRQPTAWSLRNRIYGALGDFPTRTDG